jgi:uncharacterized membrane protein
MPNTRLPTSIFFVLGFLAVAQYAHYAPRLPQIVGSHFIGDGTPNAWQTKTVFFTTEVLIVALAAVLGFGVPRLIAAMPPALINLPNKTYWLAPDHREEAMSYLQMHMAWFACALLAFLLLVMELVFRANLHQPPRVDSATFIAALTAFLVFVAISTIRLITHFAKPASR